MNQITQKTTMNNDTETASKFETERQFHEMMFFNHCGELRDEESSKFTYNAGFEAGWKARHAEVERLTAELDIATRTLSRVKNRVDIADPENVKWWCEDALKAIERRQVAAAALAAEQQDVCTHCKLPSLTQPLGVCDTCGKSRCQFCNEIECTGYQQAADTEPECQAMVRP